MKPVRLVLEGSLTDFNKKFLIGVFMHRFDLYEDRTHRDPTDKLGNMFFHLRRALNLPNIYNPEPLTIRFS